MSEKKNAYKEVQSVDIMLRKGRAHDII